MARRPLAELDVFTVAQASVVVSMSPHTVRRCCEEGDLRCYRLPQTGPNVTLRVRRADLIAWAEKHGIGLDWQADQHQED